MSNGAYRPGEIEAKWQGYWLSRGTFKSEIDRSKPKYYVLDMFPYPSGDGQNVGNPEGYVATDIVARYKRMRGFNVLHPMGWDAFGLPAERHAMRTGEHPAIITNTNCETFKRQIRALGLSYDWDREINTTDPKYVKWTQWIFEVLYERGLAYQIEAPVNWCPALGTVLANEEVKDGKYVETGDPVEKRLMKQWMLRITEYAEKLLAGLDDVDWPEGIKTMQREWIGRSEGADVTFRVAGGAQEFTVYTTRPDTLFGATYCVLAPEHSLVGEVTTDGQREAVEAYVKKAAARSAQDRMRDEREKSGVFTGAHAVNPANGEEVPIWIADYVLAEYGYGAIMAVPGGDQRDYDFAKAFDLPIVEVVTGGDVLKEAYAGEGRHVNSGFLDGLDVADGKAKMIAWLEEEGVGTGTVNYKLRDWLFSRQRYWGEPFPLIELEDGTIKAVPMKDLPVTLPDLDEYKPTAEGEPPLARATDWVETTDPETGKPARRETNTMSQWAGSCWYFLRFCDPTNDEAAWSKEAEEYWMPVDLYIGGAEHAVLHLLYARFWHKVLYDAGHVHTKEPFQKLFNQGMILAPSYKDQQGKYYYPYETKHALVKYFTRDEDSIEIEMAYANGETQLYSESRSNPPASPSDLVRLSWDLPTEEGGPRRYSSRELSEFVFVSECGKKVYNFDTVSFEPNDSIKPMPEPLAGETDFPAIDAYVLENSGKNYLSPSFRFETQIEKMSKSRLNVVNPDEVISRYGADSMRLYEMFMGPLDRDKPWTDEGVQGVNRFLKRAWSLFIGEDGEISSRIVDTGGDESLQKVLHHTIKSVGEDIEKLFFNTSIARMMEFVNAALKCDAVERAWAEDFVLVLAPFAPHMAEELWERLGHGETLAYAPWPEYDAALLVEDTVEIPVQVNGKLRGRIVVAADAGEDTMLAAAKGNEKVAQYLVGKSIVKEIVVPGRMVNLVVK